MAASAVPYHDDKRHGHANASRLDARAGIRASLRLARL